MTNGDVELCTVEEAIEELRAGRMIVLVDDEYRENEGDLVIAAERVTPATINFMLSQARGVLCLAMSAEICDRLHLGSQTSDNTSRMGTHFTIKFDALAGLVSDRGRGEKLVRREMTVKLPTAHGDFDLVAYTTVVDPEPHLALCRGGVGVEVNGVVPLQPDSVLVRIHSQCLTGDIFDSLLCDCGSQLHQAMEHVTRADK